MITQYIQAAMRKARYEILENNEGFYGEIPDLQGVCGMHRILSVVEKIWQKRSSNGFFSTFRITLHFPKSTGSISVSKSSLVNRP